VACILLLVIYLSVLELSTELQETLEVIRLLLSSLISIVNFVKQFV